MSTGDEMTAPPTRQQPARGRRRARAWWLSGALVLLLLVGAGVGLWWSTRQDRGPTTMSTAQAEQMAESLRSTDAGAVTSTLAPALVDRLGTVPAPLVSTELAIDASTFRVGEPGAGSVEASTPGAAWLMTLVWSGDRWLVTSTVPR